MDAPDQLKSVLWRDSVRLIDEDIYSVLSESSKHHYDRRATIYDLVVNTGLYNSVMWGSSPRDYRSFGSRARGHPQHLPCCWIGGHLTEPYEQKTQQSPARGFKTLWHATHS